jgi:hypothetical protein
MIIEGSVELTEDADRASGQVDIAPWREHAEGRGTSFVMKSSTKQKVFVIQN